jgi:hypothetical protein
MAGTVDETSGMTQWEALDARSAIVFGWPMAKWHDVPNSALIDPKTNKLGYAVAWLLPQTSYGKPRLPLRNAAILFCRSFIDLTLGSFQPGKPEQLQ